MLRSEAKTVRLRTGVGALRLGGRFAFRNNSGNFTAMTAYRIIALLLIAAGLTLVPWYALQDSLRLKWLTQFSGKDQAPRAAEIASHGKSWLILLPVLLLATVGLYARPVDAAWAAEGALRAWGRGDAARRRRCALRAGTGFFDRRDRLPLTGCFHARARRWSVRHGRGRFAGRLWFRAGVRGWHRLDGLPAVTASLPSALLCIVVLVVLFVFSGRAGALRLC